MTCTAAALLALSIHALPGDYQSIHPGAAVQCDRFIAGAYYNSENRMSAFAGVEWPLTERLFLEAGLVTGYDAHPVLPLARLSYAVSDHMRWFVAPAATAKGEPGAVFGIEVRIGGAS